MFKEIFDNVREKKPLIHSITNYVTINDCANIVLACGASPIMAESPEESAQITSLCDGLNLNMGMPTAQKTEAMLLSARAANRKNIPTVLDPVGVGASPMRRNTAKLLIDGFDMAVIKGNASEIKTLALGTGGNRGVDADFDGGEDVTALAKSFAKRTNSVVVVTGATDTVTDGERVYLIHNGCEMMSQITGSGCMLSRLISAFVSANPDNVLISTAAAVCAMGLAGETAFERMNDRDGNASFRNYLIDAVFNMDGDTLEKGAKYEIK